MMRAFEDFAAKLDEEDDPELWRVALRYILAEIEPGPGISIEVGRCSHWLRPHQTRWTADGGFATFGIERNCPAPDRQLSRAVPSRRLRS